MSLTSNKEHSDHLSKLQEQNGEDAREEVEDNRKKKTQADQRKYIKETKKKRKVRKLIHSRVLPRRGFSSSSHESRSPDGVTDQSMSVTIFDLTLNERMNGLAC